MIHISVTKLTRCWSTLAQSASFRLDIRNSDYEIMHELWIAKIKYIRFSRENGTTDPNSIFTDPNSLPCLNYFLFELTLICLWQLSMLILVAADTDQINIVLKIFLKQKLTAVNISCIVLVCSILAAWNKSNLHIRLVLIGSILAAIAAWRILFDLFGAKNNFSWSCTSEGLFYGCKWVGYSK